jgi:CspA family cold shock protein
MFPEDYLWLFKALSYHLVNHGVLKAMAQRIRGVVKWFSAEKGYGFITPDNGPDVFVHYSAIQTSGYRKLEAGEKVEFEITEGPKGKQASSVTAI